MVDAADARHASVIESMQTDIDRLRDTWAAGYAEQRQAHEDRLAAVREGTRAWIKGLYADAESGHIDVAGADRASVSSTGNPKGHRSQQPNPHEAELAAAQQIKQMPMAEYAARRAELGVRSGTDMSRLFGETR